jgi:hypothetical protein
MALGPDRKIEIAWEFLRRNQAYRTLWDQFSKDQSKLLRSIPKPSARSRLRGRIGIVERLKIKYRRQFQAQFGVADFFDPTSTPSIQTLKKMFKSVKPVGEFAPGLEFNPDRLHISIDPAASQRDILEAVREVVSNKQKQLGIKPRLKFPREQDIPVYLLILDSYQQFSKADPAKIKWTVFADFLNKELSRRDDIITPEDLSRSMYKQAMQLRDQAPFSILRNHK